MKSDSGAEPAGPERPRLSREEASRALVDAAATLFAERPSGRVTVREIAARAGVNPTYVHRYFGGKQNLMRAAMEKSQRAIAANITGMADVRQRPRHPVRRHRGREGIRRRARARLA